jgi:hypothetical protein
MFLVENGYLPSAGVTQLVECDLAKVDVAGSNPVSRSKTFTDSLTRVSGTRDFKRGAWKLMTAKNPREDLMVLSWPTQKGACEIAGPLTRPEVCR